MSNRTGVVNAVPEVSQAEHRPCAFCQIENLITHRPKLDHGVPHRASTSPYRCLLNPGKFIGPDGEEISPETCTPERQAACQLRRRQEFARLCATVPALRRMVSSRAHGSG